MAEEEDDFYHTLQLGELPHSTCLSYRTGSQRECLLAAFDSNKKIVLVKKDEAVVARACLRLTKGAFQKPSAVDFSFADLSQENTEAGKSAADEKAVLFLESIYTFGLNDIEKRGSNETGSFPNDTESGRAGCCGSTCKTVSGLL